MSDHLPTGRAMPLPLHDYRALVALDKPFHAPAAVTGDDMDRLVEQLMTELLSDTKLVSQLRHRAPRVHADLTRRELLRALLTVRPPEPFLPSDFHERLDRVLQFERSSKPIVEAALLPTVGDTFPDADCHNAASLALWQGDITCLQADAIVNAANNALLGCFLPFHGCIDNAIHLAAGPRLREDCARIMSRQGTPEPTGHAKITRGYHLPARFVLHTIGPIIRDTAHPPASEDEAALAACYRACLDLAAHIADVRTVAFPCISTGVFGYPQAAAAHVAIRTVDAWLTTHPGRFDRVVFNVFGTTDRTIYARLFSRAATKNRRS